MLEFEGLDTMLGALLVLASSYAMATFASL
jgi:hypothetical protein